MLGQALQAFRNQNHLAHIDAHQAFFSSALVKGNLQTLTILQAHIMEHLSIQAREEVEQEMKPQVEEMQQKFGGEVPEEEQLRMQEILESKVAERIVEMTEKLVMEEQEALQQQQEDPLIALKQQELGIRADDLERKKVYDAARIGLDTERVQQTESIAEAKMDSQEDIAQLRANVNLEKANTPKKEKIQKDVNFED